MTWAEFKKKWGKFSGKESSAYQEHFNDLCALLGQPTPAAADPTGNKSFCFQKRVLKDAELFAPDDDAGERGFADVWKAGHFAWEYKGKKKNLDLAYKQLLQYRESLQNPPLLVVCDFDRFIIRTNFNGTVQEVYDFPTSQIDEPRNLKVLRSLFSDPDFLKPTKTTAEVTEKLAAKIASVAKSLQDREGVELEDARSRREITVAKGKNLRIARFLNRLTFCFFAEDTNLLPKGIMSGVIKAGIDDLSFFSERLEELFRVMAKGGAFGTEKIRHFNGHLFEDSSVYLLERNELDILAEAAEADWQFIEPSILGTLFERGLDPSQRSQLGAHYTSREDILTLVEPVLMQPFRRTWAEIRKEQALAVARGKGTPAHRARLAEFLKTLSEVTVLDPACGSGNFLYVSLQLLLALEKEVLAHATQMGFKFSPQVSVDQLRAIEINPYAFELAQVSVQIGYLQWRRENGFDNERTPVLQTLEGFKNDDALLRESFRKAPTSLKAAQAEEHAVTTPIGSDQVEFVGGQQQPELGAATNKKKAQPSTIKVYTERAWPEASVIVGNPPFLGDKLMRQELGDDYVEALRQVFKERIPGQSDLCCYWFEKARQQLEEGHCHRAGLLATQGIRGGANREVLKRIKETGDIFFAESDREWILAGATVHVSMVGFDSGQEIVRMLDGNAKQEIPPNLTSGLDTTASKRLLSNASIGFIGISMHGPFDMDEVTGLTMLNQGGNPNSKPNSDVVRPVLNAFEITSAGERRWLVSFQPEGSLEEALGYEAPMRIIRKNVYPLRQKNHRKTYRDHWWLPGEARPAMQKKLSGSKRFIATPRVSKHRLFVWVSSECLPSDATVAFASVDDYLFGLLHSRFHEVWSLIQGTQLREKESGFRYTPTTCFETFPFPRPTAEQEEIIASAAKELDGLRQNWLNPKEWTKTEVLEFPGTVGGPWDRYIDAKTAEDRGGFAVGTVRYPRTVAKDAACAEKLKERTLTNLYNERPSWLAQAHGKLDAAVAAAYRWPTDLSDDDILARLLELNLARAKEEEAAQPMPSAMRVKEAKPQRAKGKDDLV
jgi:hypothetical protein